MKPALPDARAALLRRAAPLLRAAPFAIMPALTALFDSRYHEFWRDEAQAVLVARDVPSPEWLVAMRMEGGPFFFHAWLRLALTVLSPVGALLAVGALGVLLLQLGTFRLLEAIGAGRTRSMLLSFAFSASYIYAYELGVVIRPYAMGLGLALLALAYLRDGLRTWQRRYVIAGTVAGSLSVLTSSHSACIAGGAFLVFGLLALTRRGGLRVGWPILASLPCFGLTLFLGLPFGPRPVVPVAESRLLQRAPQVFLSSFVPQDWWSISWRAPHAVLDAVNLGRHWALLGIAIALCLGLVAQLFSSPSMWRLSVFDVLAPAVGATAVLEIVIDHYWGGPRHLVFMAVPFLVIIAGWGAAASPTAPALRALRWCSLGALAPWLAVEVALAYWNAAADVVGSFSDTKGIAYLMPPDAHVVADAFHIDVGLLLWRPGMVTRGTDASGAHRTYTVWDRDLRATVPPAPLVAAECAEAPDRVYYVSRGGIGWAGNHARCFTHKWGASQGEADFMEHFDAWQVDCACMTAK